MNTEHCTQQPEMVKRVISAPTSTLKDAEQVAPGEFLPIAQDGGTVDLGGGPNAEWESEQEQHHREYYLPDGHSEGNAEKHGDRRGERNDGKPCADGARRLVDHGRHQQDREYQRDGHR